MNTKGVLHSLGRGAEALGANTPRVHQGADSGLGATHALSTPLGAEPDRTQFAFLRMQTIGHLDLLMTICRIFIPVMTGKGHECVPLDSAA
jgi:hypothetical protein